MPDRPQAHRLSIARLPPTGSNCHSSTSRTACAQAERTDDALATIEGGASSPGTNVTSKGDGAAVCADAMRQACDIERRTDETSRHRSRTTWRDSEFDYIRLKTGFPSDTHHRKAVIEAVQRDGMALQYAADELRADREVVLKAVRDD
eukprot:4688048-Prymnesium_polylepis.1